MFVFGSSSNASGKTWKFHTEKNDALKTEKPISSNRSTLPEQNLTLLAAAVKAHTEGIKKSETEKPVTNIRSGLWSPEQNFPIIQSSNVPVTKIKKIYFRGKAIIIRLPSHDERQPRRVTEADYEDKFYSWMAAHQTIISTPTALVDKQETAGNYDDPAKISEDLKSLQIGTSENAKGSKEADGKLGLKNSTPGSGEGELKTKKSPIVDAEEQGTQPSKDQSLGISYTGADGSDEVDDDSIGKYFIYRTNESFHARSYDAAIWDSDGENDQSYASPISGSEADFEGSDIDIEEDDADDEGSESGSSNDYDDASIEALLSELKPENERVNSPSGSFQGPPGQVSDLTLDDIDNFLYTAANVISGEAFIRLKPIHNLIENLNGVDLLDATWRCIENWDGQSPNLYSDQMKRLLATVENLNDFVVTECADIDPFKHHHLTMGLRKKELDETLQRMQKKGDWRLRILLQSLLRSWDGEKCMELLSNELLESAPDEFDNMLQEAFDVVYSDSNLVDTVQ
ncbi:uncharacterized protein BHQ10_004304 [Talaromyces amestolkiae]|uniref:Uncharacterized protein n=1 Tax=Talaromyces amestolkiae TaxID=1196081 RepID=A0A364KXL2_TALAM|nr:uncharacterized protein BHQ10_004304 [Talaromyces amestolkiae]RAO68292.1 hypothetical protein BHQ10_004304 [Talaromyces amestolkiae]